jgi:Ca-activated chloride channel homolog
MKKYAPIPALAFLFLALPLAWPQQGPTREGSDTVAKPRKKDGTTTTPDATETQQPKIPSKYGKKEDKMPVGPTFRSEATTVTVDVSVLDKNGHFIPGIAKEKFRILEDNVPQSVTKFEVGNEAPMTVAMVIEFSNRFQQFYSEPWYETLMASYGFVQTLKPEDYVAIVAYDMRSEILSDFSTNRQDTYEALQRLRIAGFSESNLYDAVCDTAQRMDTIEGRKAIVLIASGIDTFSKLTFDKARKCIQESGVPIYAIGLMQAIREIADARGYMGAMARMDFLQADNQMKTFSKESGGQSFFPHFYGEFPMIFRSISDSLRNQYTLTYTPSNTVRDGKFRRIKVELVDPSTGEALRVVDEKGKPMKYTVLAKTGYTAPREVE